MDLDYLEQRREEELKRAAAASCEASRAAHRGLAALYGAVLDGTLSLPLGDEDVYPLADSQLDALVAAGRTTAKDAHDKYADDN